MFVDSNSGLFDYLSIFSNLANERHNSRPDKDSTNWKNNQQPLRKQYHTGVPGKGFPRVQKDVDRHAYIIQFVQKRWKSPSQTVNVACLPEGPRCRD